MLKIEILEEFSREISFVTPKILAGIIILFVFYIVGLITEKATFIICQKAQIHKDIMTLLGGRSFQITLILLGLVSALRTMGINVSALVASLGLTGFALGFALKDALSNVLAGVLILIYQPFQCGEKIRVAGYEGKVVSIDLRYTTMHSEERKVLIPNASIFHNPLVIDQKQ